MNIVLQFISLMVTLIASCMVLSAEESSVEIFKDQYSSKHSIAQPGQLGYWKTVTEGTVPQEFQLKIIGSGPYPGGSLPGWSFTLFEALDPEQIDFGGVHGMSGSPVFVKVKNEDGSEEDRLIGAYAYGFDWVKGRTPLWATPIEAMKDLFNYGKKLPASNPSRLAFSESIRRFSMNTEYENTLPTSHHLKFPLATGGFSQKILDYLQPQCAARGLHLSASALNVPSTGLCTETFSAEELNAMLQPGGAVAAVLMQGDFFMGGIGTVTYRDGNKILAMGHPILNLGTTRMPIMAAKILTIVNRYESSSKFGYPIGPVLGTFYQDRLAGLAGEVGWITEMLPMTVIIESPYETKTYTSNMIQHRDWIPLLASAALAGSLDASSNQVEEQSYSLEATIKLKGHDPLHMRYFAIGSQAFQSLLKRFRNLLELITNNPFELPYFEKIETHIKVTSGLESFDLVGAALHTKDPKPGKAVELSFTVNSYQDQKQVVATNFILPKNHPNFSKLCIYVAPAHEATAITEPRDFEKQFRSLDDILFYLRDLRQPNAFYVQLLEPVDYCKFSHDQRLSSSRLDQYRKYNKDENCIAKSPEWRVLEEKVLTYPALCTGTAFLLKI